MDNILEPGLVLVRNLKRFHGCSKPLECHYSIGEDVSPKTLLGYPEVHRGLDNIIEQGLHGFTSRMIEPGHHPRELRAPEDRIVLAHDSSVALFGSQVHKDLHYFEPDIYQPYGRIARQVLLSRCRLCFQVLLLI